MKFNSFLGKPLDRCRVTQPFGVDWTGGQLPLPSGLTGGYAALGLKAHNGIDFSLYPNGSGTPVFAACDGTLNEVSDRTNGYGLHLRQYHQMGTFGGERYEADVIYGHLQKVMKTGEVRRGDLIAEGDNSGISTGPHLHLGLRFRHWRKDGSGPYYDSYENGYFGYIDPMPYFLEDPTLLPVDGRYGLKESERGYSDIEWYKVAAWIWRTARRLPTTREKNALVWGRWDWRTLNDPAMFATWSEKTKMAFLAGKK